MEWIKENKQLAIIAAGIGIILILVIFALIPNNLNSNIALIEQPLYFYQKRRVTLPEEVYKDFDLPKRRLEIYRIKNENQNIKVEGLITLLNISSPVKTNFSNVAYEWKNKAGDLVEYNTKTQVVRVDLENTANVFSELNSPSDSQLQSLLQQFVQKNINDDYQYSDITLDKKPGEIKIAGRRIHNDIPLQMSGIDKGYDYIILDDRNRLKEAKILIVNFEDQIVDRLELLKPEQVSNVISTPTYPKEIVDGVIEGLNEDTKEGEKGTDNLVDELPRPTSYTIDNLEIVYLFSNTSLQFLTPVYRFNASGQVVYKGNTYNVKGVVNASSIDPDHVYIPSNIIYAD